MKTCKNCGRKFKPMGLGPHMRSCKPPVEEKYDILEPYTGNGVKLVPIEKDVRPTIHSSEMTFTVAQATTIKLVTYFEPPLPPGTKVRTEVTTKSEAPMKFVEV